MLACALPAKAAGDSQLEVEKSWVLGKVVADFPVGYCLLTDGKRQYVGYYDLQRRMTVASRLLESDEWKVQVLPSEVAWDSHNYIAMAVDAGGHLHVSGNMHAVPLVYFRTDVTGDISTLKAAGMVGQLENRMTYPNFIKDSKGQLIFTYRHGGSGNGIQIYNKYDPTSRKWSRFLDQPLLDGKGDSNAYASVPSRGPDGRYHMAWVWRDTPDCATNHHLSYARSEDLVHWESAAGEKASLPLTLDQKALWVDPIPSGGGIINGGFRLLFDSQQRPILGYHKSDAAGNMQLYVSRHEGGEWRRRQLTNWDKPVVFAGGGSMGSIGIGIGEFSRVNDSVLRMVYDHKDYGRGEIQLNERTLEPLSVHIPVKRELPKQLDQLQSRFEGMRIMRSKDEGNSGDERVRYLLQWETLGANRDRSREGPLPEPSTLMLYKLRVVK